MDIDEGLGTGTLDHATPTEQMASVDKVMRLYFGSKDWVQARTKEFPGMRRARPQHAEPGCGS